MVADLINGREASYEGTQGTMICKVFDLSAGATGNNEKRSGPAGGPMTKCMCIPPPTPAIIPVRRPSH